MIHKYESSKLKFSKYSNVLFQGKLDVPYKGIGECATRTMKNEGALSFWRGKYCYFWAHF